MSMGLKEIPIGSPEIKSINLAYNHLDCLPASVFSNNLYKALRQIELSNNKISNISEYAFVHLAHLRYVDLSYNNITALDSFTFKANPNLRKLDLSFNKIHIQHDRFFCNRQIWKFWFYLIIIWARYSNLLSWDCPIWNIFIWTTIHSKELPTEVLCLIEN